VQAVEFISSLFVSGYEEEALLFVCYVKHVGSRKWVAKGFQARRQEVGGFWTNIRI